MNITDLELPLLEVRVSEEGQNALKSVGPKNARKLS